jgi:hypothetical protein
MKVNYISKHVTSNSRRKTVWNKNIAASGVGQGNISNVLLLAIVLGLANKAM